MRQKKRIRELRRSGSQHPDSRKQIEDNRIVPHVLGDRDGMYWDGFNALDQNGKFWSISTSMQAELINMMIAGRYGEIVKDAFFDQTTYWKIRDDLIEWPNQEKIEQGHLRVVALQLLDLDDLTTNSAAGVT